MRTNEKVGFIDSFTDLIIHLFFSFQVVLLNPIALVAFIIIILIGLYIGFKELILNRERKVWTNKNKKDLLTALVLFIVVGMGFYFINKY